MASLIPGYEYDIFISYRQKDNKYDSWVTEFVENLKRELEATFKEDISVYFDINPHDGLLETHDVEASLKEKIKCLIFIPIISHTYCDPKSFAWEHEFKAFIDLASHDKFGLKVKLPGGNVTNRVLPVRIHELDPEDIKLCESALGGYLRGVEFIYREPGVNRSLTPDDDENKNLNKTRFRNQINKVANAVKEIIAGLKTGHDVSGAVKPDSQLPWEEVKKVPQDKQAELKKSKLLSYAISAVLVLVLLGVYIYPKIFKPDSLEKLKASFEKISIAVMPFKNMTGDTLWNLYQEGIQGTLITSLSNEPDLSVRPIDIINIALPAKGLTDASFTTDNAKSISQKIDAEIFIYGSVKKAGQSIRIEAQLIDTKSQEVFKSFNVQKPYDENNILPMIDTLSAQIRDFMLMTKIIKENLQYKGWVGTTKSPEAFRYFVYGKDAFNKWDLSAALSWFLKAVSVDSNYYDPYIEISSVYSFMGMQEQNLRWVLKYYKKRMQWPVNEQLSASWAYAINFESPDEQIKYLRQLHQLDEQDPNTVRFIGLAYNQMGQFDKAVHEFEISMELFKKWRKDFCDEKGIKDNSDYYQLSYAYYRTGQYQKEKKILREYEQYIPGDPWILYLSAILALAEKDTVLSKQFLDKYIAFHKKDQTPEPNVKKRLADIYKEAGYPDKAEEFFREALSLEPNNPERLFDLAGLYIDSNRNMNEIPELMDKAMGLAHNKIDYYNYSDRKGWGLYKQGKTKEALEILQKCWDEAPFKLYSIRSHYEEVKKAACSLN
jgi:tetratricopeptide (TPR) repeat protein